MRNDKLKRVIAVTAVVVLLLVEFMLFHDFAYPFRTLWEQGKVSELFLSLTLLFWCVVGFFFVFFSGRSRLRKMTLPIFLFVYLFNIGSYQVSNSPIDFQQSTLIVDYFYWWFWEVVENFGLAVLPLLLLLVPVIFLVERLPAYTGMNFSRNTYLIPISALLLATVGLQYSNGFVDRYPSFFRIPSLLVFAAQSELYQGPREELAYSGPLVPQVEKVVLIVDESIRADIMGVNGYPRETTPYLDSQESGVVNFGQAAASTNCSDYSNLVLRSGLKKTAIPDSAQVSLREPSIWQFMRRAGYRNVYLDAQSKEEWENYQNFMDENEAAFIDELLWLRQEVAYESDGVARTKLIELLRRPGKTFIVLNKYGMHFPYFRSHPEEYGYYTPALEQGEPMNDRERSLNSYMNGLRWSVDDWFKGLFAHSAEFRPYVFIYTGDHGQNIVDDGTLATHCRPRANRFEGIVPMMVFSNDDTLLEEYRAVQSSGYDKTSHFQVFPTLLDLAGYEASWVSSHYGASLSELSTSPPEFFVGDLHGRGSVREWVPIFQQGARAE